MANYNNYNSGLGWKILSLFLALIIVAGVITGVVFWQKGNITFTPIGQGQEQPNDEDETPDDGENTEQGSAFDESIVNGEYVTLALSRVASASESDSAFSKKITATVKPDDAPDKNIDWSISWDSSATRVAEEVTDFVTVTPLSDGSNEAIISCLASFEGDKIIVTATTRVGGYQAYCILEFKGFPQTLSVDTSSANVIDDSAWSVSVVEVSAGTSYTFPLSLDNDIHAVGSTFGANYEVTTKGIGGIILDRYYEKDGRHEDYTLTNTANSMVEGAFTIQTDGGGFLKFFNFEIVDGNLVIDANASPSSISNYGGNPSVGVVRSTFKGYTDNKPFYVELTVTESVSGISQTINLRVISTVTGVTVDTPSIVF